MKMSGSETATESRKNRKIASFNKTIIFSDINNKTIKYGVAGMDKW